jgi:threonine synthase
MTMLNSMRRHRAWLKWTIGAAGLGMVLYLIPTVGGSMFGAGEDTVATVEGQKINLKDFQRQLNQRLQMFRGSSNLSPQMLKQLGIDQQVLQEMLDDRATIAEAERRGLSVSDAEVREAIMHLPGLQENGQFVGEDRYRALLRMQRPPMSPSDFEDILRRELMRDKLQQAVTGWITVSDSDVEQEYRRRNEKVKLDVVSFSADAFKKDLTATSGDTGGAAVDAFAGLDNVDLIVLFPHGRISDVQRRMMTTAGAGNVHALAIEGTFDDCQAIVKALFNHHKFRDRVALSGVNSINWARIVAQIVYYFTSAVALGAPARTVDFTVPTGNFGDIFAGYAAKRMGLPVRWLRIAANINDILPRTLKTGIYEVRDVHATASPSMDIQISSNFERLLFEASRRDAAGVRRLMEQLKQSGRFVLPDATLAAVREEFDAGRADETETAAAIRAAWREAGDLVDPHTAVALAVADRDTSDSRIPNIVLSTAHAAKFPDAVEAACGVRPQLPAWLDGLLTKSEHMTVMKNEPAEVERFVQSVSRAARQGVAG